MRVALLAGFALVTLSSVACGGGGGGGSPLPNATLAPSPAPSSAPNATGSATFAIFIPSATAMKKARPAYVSPNTQSAAITVTEVSGSPIPSPTPLVVALTPGSPNCSTSANGTTCTITATYRVGLDGWTVALYGQGGVTSTPLSITNVSQQVNAGQNTVNLTLNPVIASLTFSPSGGTCLSSDATCVQPGQLEALDATNAVIVGPGNYVNASQTPVTINVGSPPSGVTLETSTGAAAARSASGPAQLNLAQIAYHGAGSPGTLMVSASDTKGDTASYTLNLTASATPTPYPPDPPSKIRSTYGRIGLAQIFDQFVSTGAAMSSATILSDAHLYDMVWGSFDPSPWSSGNPQALVSRYYIIEEDNILVSGKNLQSWLTGPNADWILYACTSNGTPTHDYAYTPSDGFQDVPLNIHNQDVVNYQVQNLLSYAKANNYNALALDEVVFTNFMEGGNPPLGQTVKAGEYACGTWNNDGTFNMVYSSPGKNATWMADTINWVNTAKLAASQANPPVAVLINHPIGSTTDPNEKQLIAAADGTVDESGFSGYGNYVNNTDPLAAFRNHYNYMEWVEGQGKAVIDIDRYTLNLSSQPNKYSVSKDQLEYAIGTYMMANEGNADLFVDADNSATSGYGVEQYYNPEYATALGPPCGPMYEDAQNAAIYYRRFQNGMVVVNAGGSGTENATLPTNHTYTDLEGTAANHAPVTNPLPVTANDAWVLTTGGGNGCT